MTKKAVPVQVRLSTEHTATDGVVQRQQEEHKGKVWLNPGVWVVRFTERTENRETGTTTIKAKTNQMTIIRRGETTMRHTFEPHQETIGLYKHPYGRMEMITKTTCLRKRALQNGWEMKWHYHLTMNGVEMGTFHMTLLLTPP